MNTKRWIALSILFGISLFGLAAWWLTASQELPLEDWPWPFLSPLTAAPSLILTWYWRTTHKERDLDNDAQRLLTDRFNKAIELLGSDKLQIRLGGIYALERIAQDSERDHWTVMETLCAFVREQTRGPKRKVAAPENGEPLDEEGKEPPPREMFEPPDTDVRAALTIMGRRGEERRQWERKEEKRLDLQGAHLECADLQGAHLEHANLGGAHLEGADLREAHLAGAELFRAHLEGANLRAAHLERAFLEGAHLERAFLGGAHLERAELWRAHLEGAKLWGAHLEDANLWRAHLADAHLEGADLSYAEGLTQGQIDSARIDDKTKLPEGITRPAPESSANPSSGG